MKNTLDRTNNRLDTAKKKVSELKDIAIESIQNETDLREKDLKIITKHQ